MCNNSLSNLVIPMTFAECLTYETQIYWLYKYLEDLDPGDQMAIEEIKVRLDVLDRQVAELDSEVSKIEPEKIAAEIESIRMEVQQLATQTNNINATVQQHTNALTALNDELTEQMDFIADNSEQISKLQTSKQDTLTFDNTPTEGSNNPVTSDGIKKAIDAVPTGGTVDDTVTADSSNPVSSKGIYDYVESELQGKEDVLVFDTKPTYGSDRPVTSDGLYNEFQNYQPLVNSTLSLDQAVHRSVSGYAVKHAITPAGADSDTNIVFSTFCPYATDYSSITTEFVTYSFGNMHGYGTYKYTADFSISREVSITNISPGRWAIYPPMITVHLSTYDTETENEQYLGAVMYHYNEIAMAPIVNKMQVKYVMDEAWISSRVPTGEVYVIARMYW